ncbi:MAG: protein kinase domain-containing protein [Myxococcota bacterium]
MSDKPTILVVEDDPTNRRMLTVFLGKSGYQVESAEDGETALTLLGQRRYDLVLLDVMMPGISGIEVLQEIRRTYTAQQLPVIMATALGDSADIVRALSLGANDYVTKPFEFKVLLARVQTRLAVDLSRPTPKGLAIGPVDKGRDTVTVMGVGDDKQAAPAPDGSKAAVVHRLQSSRLPGLGEVLDSRYRLDEVIGTGGAGVVYRARHLSLESEVAVKILRCPANADQELLQRFRNEGVVGCRVRHPNAVQVMDFTVTDDGIAYLVMELLTGTDLADLLKAEGRVSLERSLEIIKPACEALAEAHRLGVIHRDIKPANLFLHESPRGEVVKVLDFGIAKLVGLAASAAQETTGQVVGTTLYMPPERLRNLPYDGAADVYSMGIVLFEMLTGSRPFESDDADPLAVAVMHLTKPPPHVSDRRHGTPVEIDSLVLDCMQKDPRRRPTLDEVIKRLEHAVHGP